MLQYRGYKAKVEVNQETGRLYGKVLDIADEIPFEGETFQDVQREFYRSVDAYLDFCDKLGKEPERPFPGKYLFRTTPEIHRAIYLAATRKGKSINAWTEEILSEAAKKELSPKVEIPYHLRPLVEEAGKFAKLIQTVDPFLESKELDSTMQLINELEKMWLNVETIRSFLKIKEPEAISQFLIQVWIFFQTVLKEDRAYQDLTVAGSSPEDLSDSPKGRQEHSAKNVSASKSAKKR